MEYTITDIDVKFFDLVEPFGWGIRTTDYNTVKLQLLEMTQGIQRIGVLWLADHAQKLINVLNTAVKKGS